MPRQDSVTRREFLTRSGVVVATAAVGVAGLNLVGTANAQAPAWPFPYKELDPNKAAQIAYDWGEAGHG